MSLIVSLAEIISSLAIVISLVYVASEYRRSDLLTNRDVENIMYGNMREMDRMLIENDGLARLIIKATEKRDSLLPDERIKYLAYEHIFYDSWESAWNYFQEGILQKQNWESWNSWFNSELKNKPGLSWEGNRKNYDGEFFDYIEALFMKTDQ